ncbi:uncharacterized protein [Physcomitrium patens]|uniref:uncharacterized protein isoform X5 n=1 Tax=Physcomitrium patens TaxID=3218 RepID=UPI000D176D8E|nr:uncharacterized protein LOC112280228 isoform X4 [Physcomitrium patens]|eukprot:XP_024371232.1 uncharacterized protein LOC112280228 isoform X4 [Physcomitrella patens]
MRGVCLYGSGLGWGAFARSISSLDHPSSSDAPRDAAIVVSSSRFSARMNMLRGLSFSLFLINLAAILERADESLLPAVYKEVSEAFKASPSELGSLTFIRTIVQAVCSPLAGILAMRYYRPSVIGLGTLFWAVSTAVVALSFTFTQCAFSRALNGIGLAIVVPALQSFIADSHSEAGRGMAFGWLNLVGSVGGIAGSGIATVMAGYGSIWGIAGWRVAFLLVASVSCVIGWVVHIFVLDPRDNAVSGSSSYREFDGRFASRFKTDEKVGKSIQSAWLDAWIAIKAVMKVRTFQIIVMQGLVGSLPWTAMVFFTMWLELIGFGHKAAASLMSLFSAGCAIGAVSGGWLGDRAEQKFPGKGRIMCAQFSSFMGIPCSLILLHILPQDPERWAMFASMFIFMGLTISWCQACANNPMFADVVPEEQRTVIYSFDRAFEGGLGALAAPLVGILAERVYGYRAHMVIPENGSPEEALALSRGLFAVMAIPFGLCCLCYTPLYFTYAKDKEEARAHNSKHHAYRPLRDEESSLWKL